MLAMPVRKPMKNQLCFDFAQDEKNDCVTAQKTKETSTSSVLKRRPATAKADSDLREVCVLLHTIARKSVSANNFRDFNLIARCTKLLQALGILVETPAEMRAVAADQEAALVLSAPEYRLLRSRAIAGLATVADLADRLPAKGSVDYQRGMRDAYRHASDIAALFLDDLEQFQTRMKKSW